MFLIPHEHGAYGQLGFPLAAVLLAGHPREAAGLLAIACAAAFVAYEPLLVLLGQRGRRAGRELRSDAVRTFAIALTAMIPAGLAGAWLMPAGNRWTLLVPASCATIAVVLVVWRVHRTTAGELLIALTLSSCALPVGVAAGLPTEFAAVSAAIFAAGFCAATLAVRATIAVQRRGPASTARVAATMAALLAPAVVRAESLSWRVHPLLWTAAVPLSVLAVVLAVAPPSARHLRRVGWSLVAASAAEMLVLVVLIRV